MLGLIGGGVAAFAALVVVARSENSSSTGDAETEEFTDEEVSDNEAELGDYTVSWPDGWTVDARSDSQLVLVGAGAAVVFRAYAAGDDVTATEEAQRLLNRHTAGLGKRRTGTASTTSGSVESATIEASGTRGDDVRIEATVQVRIEPDDRTALAVIALLPSDTSTARRKEISRMRGDFLDQLG